MTKASVLAVLTEHGSMTCHEVCDELGLSQETVRAHLRALHRDGAIRIAAWRREAERGRIYPRQVWLVGDGEDAPRPRPTPRKVVSRRYRERQKRRPASVFHLAGTSGMRQQQILAINQTFRVSE